MPRTTCMSRACVGPQPVKVEENLPRTTCMSRARRAIRLQAKPIWTYAWSKPEQCTHMYRAFWLDEIDFCGFTAGLHCQVDFHHDCLLSYWPLYRSRLLSTWSQCVMVLSHLWSLFIPQPMSQYWISRHTMRYYKGWWAMSPLQLQTHAALGDHTSRFHTLEPFILSSYVYVYSH